MLRTEYLRYSFSTFVIVNARLRRDLQALINGCPSYTMNLTKWYHLALGHPGTLL